MNDSPQFAAAVRHPVPPALPAEAYDALVSRRCASSVSGRFAIQWACSPGQVRAAQGLRQAVFGSARGHDIDLFDDHCEHLLLTDAHSAELMATCRVLTPQQARRVGSTCCDTEFDLTRLRALREHMAELGRLCVRADQRDGLALRVLWRTLLSFLRAQNLGCVVGSVDLPTVGAASLWQQLQGAAMAPIEDQVRTRVPARLRPQGAGTPATALPTALKLSLKLGARVLGHPAWDADAGAIHLPMLLRLRDLPSWAQSLG